MAFELGDVRGGSSKKEKAYALRRRPMNMLDKSQNAMNDKARAGYDAAYTDKKLCENCPGYSADLDTCMLTYSRKLCLEKKA